LKSVRNSYLIITGIVAFALFLAGLAEVLDSGVGEGWRFGSRIQNGTFVLVCHVTGAVGVILLGCYWLKLAGAITSIAKLLRADEAPDAQTSDKKAPMRRRFCWCLGLLTDEINIAIRERFKGYRERNCLLEEQIRDLQVQVQLSHRQKRNTEAIIYGIRDAVIVVDESDRLLMANDAAGRLLNFDCKSSQHRPVGELIGADHSEFVDFLRHARQSRERATRREIGFVQEGRPGTFDCIVSCVYDEREQVCGAVAVLHDVTREKEISQMKNDFVSHVSHELKTPLASITAYSEMLADGEASDEETKRQFCSVIHSQADRLNRLIEDILNTARIESGLIKVEKEPLSLTILIEEQLEMIKSCAEEKNIKVIGQKPIIFDRVYADRDMISQVIINLLSNAVKYTPSGGSVRIGTEVDEIARVARVTVSDTGVGIPENEIEHVFDKFYRVGANKSQAKGTGLGLNLVKKIIEEVHNGRVFVASKPGEGSTFGFELPLATAETVETVR